MPQQPTILVLGLEESLATELECILSGSGGAVHERAFGFAGDCAEALENIEPDLVFCPNERPRYEALLELMSRRSRRIPVVVVSGQTDVAGWLDALEAGAADYCAPPFETRQVAWILDNNIPARPRTAVQAA